MAKCIFCWLNPCLWWLNLDSLMVTIPLSNWAHHHPGHVGCGLSQLGELHGKLRWLQRGRILWFHYQQLLLYSNQIESWRNMMIYPDLPIKNGDLPVRNDDLPIKNGDDFQGKKKTMSPGVCRGLRSSSLGLRHNHAGCCRACHHLSRKLGKENCSVLGRVQ